MRPDRTSSPGSAGTWALIGVGALLGALVLGGGTLFGKSWSPYVIQGGLGGGGCGCGE